MAESFDFVIIGAGIAGASVAAQLASTHRVAVLERESQPGYHSTGRSAAIFSSIYSSSLIRALTAASRQFIYHSPVGFSPAPLVKRRGALFIADSGQVEALKEFAARPDVQPHAKLLSGDRARELVPVLRREFCAAALLETEAADLDVNALHQGFLTQLRAAGGRLVLDCEVEGLERTSMGWVAKAREASFAAAVIINAAGAWADRIATLAGVEPLGLKPSRRTAILVDPPEGEDSRHWPAVIDLRETFYFKPDAGLLLVSPADETATEPCDTQPEELDVAIAVDRLEKATTLNVRHVRKRWAGLRNFLPDRSPAVGFEPGVPGFFWLAGQGGAGVQTAPAMSSLAAALACQRCVPSQLEELGVVAGLLDPSRFRDRRSSHP